jgi:protein TonB
MSRIKKLKTAVCVVIAGVCLLLVPESAQPGRNEGGTATEELRNLMTTAVTAARVGNQEKLNEIAHELMIPNYENWFRTTFGEEDGAKMAAAYQKSFEWEESWLPKPFLGLSKDKGEWLIEKVEEPIIPDAMPCQQALVRAARKGAAFYLVSLQMTGSSGNKAGYSAGYYTQVGGAYRRLDCAGMGLGISGGVASGAPTSGAIRMGGNVQAARIISRVPPVYPVEARKAGISGNVRLHIIVAKDGTVEQVELVSGHPLLAPAAIDAVRQWKYQITTLNGTPVEVDTTVDLVFSLNN